MILNPTLATAASQSLKNEGLEAKLPNYSFDTVKIIVV